eukprot:scaffold119_cov131-Cylindrotheca_fusiformis.AAC.7
MTPSVRIILCFVAILGISCAYQPTVRISSRRDWFSCAAATATVVLVSPEQPASAVLSSKYCAYGAGQDCDDLAEGNEFIRKLQAQSAANKEKNVQDAKYAYYMKNYPDWFATVGKTMVRKPDGSFMLVDDEELMVLKRENKIGVENVKAMGGKVADLTQKPILVLKE